MSLFLKLDFNKIELQVELDINNVEYKQCWVYVVLNIANVEFYLKIYIEFNFEENEFT